jgi:hypothetical protein
MEDVMKKLLVASTLALMATAAQAAPVLSSTAGAPDTGPLAGQVVVYDFNAATPELSGSYSLEIGSGPGYAAPAGDTTQFAVVPIPTGPSSGSAILDLPGTAKMFKSVSLYWGSIDQYNTLEFLNGNTVIFTILGGMLPPANGDQGAGITNRRVNVDFGMTGQQLTAMRFTSTSRAFEFDDVALGAVPEPQSWALMIVGFGLVGAAARRRTRMTSVTA